MAITRHQQRLLTHENTSSQTSTTVEKPSSIHRLPYELIAMIFVYGLSPIAWYYNDFFLRTITSVCSQWRGIALSTSTLWSNIVFSGEQETLTQDLDQLSTYLRRSGTSSIRIRMRLAHRLMPQDIEEIRTIILPHLHRSHSLHFRFPGPTTMSMFLPLQGRMDRLENMYINCERRGNAPDHPVLFEDACVAPLRSIHMFGLCAGSLSKLPANHLRYLFIHHSSEKNTSWTDIMLLLGECATVTEMTLLLSIPCPLSSLSSVTLPLVESLAICDDLPLPFLRHVTTPKLERLEVHNASAPDELQFAWTPTFKLRSLTLSHSHVTEAELATLFEAHPTIETLILEICTDAILILKVLDCGRTQTEGLTGLFLPYLKTLEFRYVTESLSMWGGIASLLKQRPSLRVIWSQEYHDPSGAFMTMVSHFGDRLVGRKYREAEDLF